ncbi:MAG TPA: MDR family MFS transporter [Blastocatellia bacterium]|nr:MDR family MFS transporter [Blastocatellia bacterium]
MPPVSTEFERTSITDLRTLMTVIGVAMAFFMSGLEATVIGTAMPTVVASLGGIEIYSWVFAAYVLSATIMIPVWGKTADLIGRRPALFGGLALFIIGSALAGTAHSMGQLIAFRVIQGLGAAALYPVSMTIVADILTLEQRAKLIALFSGMWGLSSIVGPLVGGYLTAYTRLSWRWCFYIILPVGLLSWGLVWWSYRERYERRDKISIDYAGTLTLSGSLVMLMLVIERGSGFSLFLNLTGLALSLALMLIFIRLERSHPEPLLPFEIFKNRMIAVSTVHGFFAMMALFGIMSFLPLFVQAVIGTNAAEAGRILVPFIIPWMTASIIGGRLILYFGYRPLVLIGMGFLLVGSALLARVTTETTRWELSGYAVFLGLGGGLTVVTLMLAAQHAAPRNQVGITTSTVQFARSIGAAFGTAIMGSLLTWRLGRLLRGAPVEISRLTDHADIGSIVRPETRQSLSPAVAAFLQHALAGSLRLAFAFVFAMVVIGAIIAFFIPTGSVEDLAHHEHRTPELPEL